MTDQITINDQQLQTIISEVTAAVTAALPGKVARPPGRPVALTGRYLAQNAAEDGWYETTTFQDLGAGRRTFLAGERGLRQISATGVELGKRTAELAALKASMLQLAESLDATGDTPGAGDEIRNRVGR